MKPEEKTPDISTPEIDHKALRIAELERQVKTLEAFVNVVVEQRNDALNQAAQYRSQLVVQAQ